MSNKTTLYIAQDLNGSFYATKMLESEMNGWTPNYDTTHEEIYNIATEDGNKEYNDDCFDSLKEVFNYYKSFAKVSFKKDVLLALNNKIIKRVDSDTVFTALASKNFDTINYLK